MYEINAENLKWAYKKLKHYIYYYRTSSYLKDKIIEFEENYNDNTFTEMSDRLILLSKKNANMLRGKQVSFTIYPKRDSAHKNIKDDTIDIKNFNMFIDMPIEFYLIDILFSMELYKIIDKNTLEYAYGNIYDKNLEFVDEPMENLLLFGNHAVNYKKWKNSIYDKESAKEKIIVKLDIERCFYNFKFKYNEFIKNYLHYDYLENSVTKIMANIYRYYTKILNDEMPLNCMNYASNEVTLPIGLFSSYSILNILLSPVDHYFAKNSFIYARYVDDILIVKETTIEEKIDKKELIFNLWPDIFSLDNNKLFLNSELMACDSLPINNDKIEIIYLGKHKNISNLDKKVKKIFFPSLECDDELELGESSIESDYAYNTQFLKQKIYSGINSNDIYEKQNTIDFIMNLKPEEYINLYSFWDQMISFFIDIQGETKVEKIRTKLSSSIRKINSNSYINPKLIDELKKQLRKELKYCIDSKSETYDKYLLNKINQNKTIEYIDGVYKKNNTINFFPINISIDELTYYLVVYQAVNNKIIDKSFDLFFEINNYYKNGDIINEEDKDNKKYIYNAIIRRDNYFERKYPTEQCIKPVINIAVANMCITEEEIEKYDFLNEFPNSFTLQDIKNLMYAAKRNGAHMIVFPEFCLPNKYAFDIIKYSRIIDMSIICGLTHVFNKANAKNFVLVRDCYLDLTIIKEKNYFAEYEKFLCVKNGYMYDEPSNPFYYIIDNGKYKYSVMTCFEATNIFDRSLLCDEIQILYMPVCNRDTSYFSNIISSYSRDASCFIVQSNINNYGDSRITGPYSQVKADIVRLKGGKNHYFVIGEINLNDMVMKHNKWIEFEKKLINYNLNFDSEKNLEKHYKEYHKMESKPLSAGKHLELRKTNNIE